MNLAPRPRTALALQIAQLDHPAQRDRDPEDLALVDLDDSSHTADLLEQGGDLHPGREHYIDVGPSALRRLRDTVADPKYDGIRISRNQIVNSEHHRSDASLHASDSDTDHDDYSNPRHSESNEDDEDIPSHSPLEALPPAATAAASDHRPAASPPTPDDLSSTLKKTREEERKKGNAVSRQVAIYDGLLDARIRLQKSVSSSNKLPDPAKLPSYLLTPEARASVNNMLTEAMAFSDDLFDLREKLLASTESVTPPTRKRRRLDATDENRDWEEEVRDATISVAQLDAAFHPYLLSTLQKWSNKILAIAPSALLPSARTKFSRTATAPKSATQLIEETIADREKLVGRTRAWRGKGVRLGNGALAENHTEEEDIEIFDDTDFYQQLLRDVIEVRNGAESGDNDWRAAQKQKKARKAVDTKASKGRKLRYEMHEKLQNFMVPVPARGAWHDDQIDELFASLLGKGFTSSQPGDHDSVMDVDMVAQQQQMAEQVEQALMGGFRVFG